MGLSLAEFWRSSTRRSLAEARLRPGGLRRGEGGGGGIRTHDTVSRMPHFKCGTFNLSVTPPILL